MKNITDLMSTGEFALAIAGKGIQVSHVRVTPDFQKINVFWIATGDQEDSVVDVALKSISGSLRHELSQLRLMGEVPRITFVRDRVYSKGAEIDILLRKADFGDYDDWTPTDPTLFMRSNFKLEMKLSPEVVTKITELENINEFVEESELPPMRHDIFGIDHSAIMKKITKNMKQNKLAWDQYEDKSAENLQFSNRMNDINKSIEKLNEEETLRDNFVKYLDRKQFSKKNTPERKQSKNNADLKENDWEEDINTNMKFDDGDYLEDEILETNLKNKKF